MKHYAGLDLSMETTQVCIVDENGGKIASMKVESAPDKIAQALSEVGGVKRAVIETGRMSPAICHGLRSLGVPVVCIDARKLGANIERLSKNEGEQLRHRME